MAKTILLADDSVMIQKVIELTFIGEEYKVESVSSGDDALQKLEAGAPDVVIADVHMHGSASGYQVARRSKELYPRVPVLLLVGSFEPFDQQEYQACGADRYLKKPFESEELERLVEDLVAASSSAPEPVAEVAPELPQAVAPDAFAPSYVSPDVVSWTDSGGDDVPMEGIGSAELEPAPGVAEPSIDLSDFDAEPVPSFPVAAPRGTDFRLDLDSDLEDSDLEDDGDISSAFSHDLGGATAVVAEAEVEEVYEETELLVADESTYGQADLEVEGVGQEEDDTQEVPPKAAFEASAGIELPAVGSRLSDEDVDRIATRVAELVGERLVRDVAWEVVPDLAEVIIKDRLRELESQIE